jgi:hypothetical protein
MAMTSDWLACPLTSMNTFPHKVRRTARITNIGCK